MLALLKLVTLMGGGGAKWKIPTNSMDIDLKVRRLLISFSVSFWHYCQKRHLRFGEGDGIRNTKKYSMGSNTRLSRI